MKLIRISKKTLENSYYLGAAQLIIVLIGLITSSIWARYTTVELYGKYQLLVSFVSMVAIFSMSGLSMSAQLSSAKGKHGNLRIIYRRKLQYSLISMIILTFVGGYYQFVKQEEVLAYMLYIASFFYPFYNLKSIWDGWINGVSEFKKLSMIKIYFSIFNLSVLFVGLVYLQNIYMVVLLVFGGVSLSNVVILKYFSERVTGSSKLDSELIRYGYTLSGAMLIPVILSFDKFLISEYLSFSDVAIYSVALMFPSQIKVLYSIVNRLISPKISSSGSIVEAWVYLKPKMLLIAVLFTMVAIIGFFTIEYVINIVFTEKYNNSIEYAKWLWLSLAITVPPVYMANILRYQQIIKFSYYFETFNAVTKFSLFLLLLPIYELWGMVYAIALSNVVSGVFFIGYFYIEIKKEKTMDLLN